MIGVDIARTRIRLREVMNTPEVLEAVDGTRSEWPQPLYGIDGASVDSDLQEQGGCASRGHPDAPELGAVRHHVVTVHRYGTQVPVHRHGVAPMVNDDQIAEAAKRAGE